MPHRVSACGYPQPPNCAGVSRAIVESATSLAQSVVDGGGEDGGVTGPVSTASESRFGPPSAAVAVARTVLVPAARAAVTVWVCHVAHEPVPLNATPVAT